MKEPPEIGIGALGVGFVGNSVVQVLLQEGPQANQTSRYTSQPLWNTCKGPLQKPDNSNIKGLYYN